ncbi:MAG: DUF1236 domain-containing protein [Pseudolabrys sp.]
MKPRISFLIAAAVVSALPAAASADVLATATTSLSIRSGPGPEHAVVGFIPENGRAAVSGCIQGSLWCQVSYNGKFGWAYSQYLSGNVAGRTVIVSQAISQVPTVTYRVPVDAAAALAAAPREVTGTIVQRSATDEPLVITPPPPMVREYIVANPADPVYLQGEVVVGAGLPAGVTLTPVPDYQYQYATVNGVPVLVEPQSRTVTYIYR